MNKNQTYADAAIVRAIELQALVTWMLFDLIDRLNTLQKEIQGAIAFYDPQNAAQGEELVQAARAKIQDAYREIENRVGENFEEAANIQAEHERDDLFALFGIGIEPIAGAVILDGLIIVGLTLSDAIRRQMGELEFRTAGAIRRGVQQSDSVSKLIERINGTSELGGEAITKIVEPSQRALEQLMRTAAEAVQEKVREKSVEAVIEKSEAEATPVKFVRYAWQSIAVLDSRTTQLCQTYHFKIWNAELKPVGHHLPFLPVPRHLYCRSRHVVIVLDDDPLTDETFVAWMNRQSDEQKKKAFGARAYDLWKAKKISDSDLIRSRERQLTFEQFKKRT